MRLFALILIVGLTVGYACAQSAPPVDPDVALEVSLAGNSQREFHIGETITLQLAFSSKVKDHYEVNMAQHDRSGRMSYERFTLSPSQGAVDPLPSNTGSMGGLTSFRFLVPEPWTIKLNLNEWVRFTQPGEYRLVVDSSRVGVRNPANPFGASPITARSNEIRLKIVAANPAWEKQVLSEAVATLDARAPTERAQVEKYTAARRQAIETLRFLGTAEAVKEMANRLRDQDSGGLDYLCMLGLIASPERAAARAALEDALADPDHPIGANFLYALGMVDAEPGAELRDWRVGQRRAIEKLLAVLPNKRGPALPISLAAAMNAAFNNGDLPQETTDKLLSQLVSMFDQLPIRAQNELLDYRWDKIKSPAMLPILKRYAQSYRDFPEMRVSSAYDSLQLSASALRRWYELDPAGARPAIITEITRPRPRYGAHVLGILPDETLPEVDAALAEHFVANHDLDGGEHLASLIARYATVAILPQVTEKLDARIGKWACSIQNPILAYVLRVSPATARPRIERAITARGKDFTACNHEVFQLISETHYDPALEDIAIRSLDDPDPEVAMTAATMLGQYGSTAAEAALWRRYETWTAKWAGHESELDLMFSDRASDLSDDRSENRTNQVGLGSNLLDAIVTGKSWLSDKSTLQRLAHLTTVRSLQRDLDGYLKIWDGPSFTIVLDRSSATYGFRGQVAQYEVHSMDALKNKLSQFPSGTTFSFSSTPVDSPANIQSVSELREFLNSHGMSVVEDKRAK